MSQYGNYPITEEYKRQIRMEGKNKVILICGASFTEQQFESITKIAEASGQDIEFVAQQVQKLSEPTPVFDIKDLGDWPKIDPFDEWFQTRKTESKIEQFENRNLGAKVVGKKHKKNPFINRRRI